MDPTLQYAVTAVLINRVTGREISERSNHTLTLRNHSITIDPPVKAVCLRHALADMLFYKEDTTTVVLTYEVGPIPAGMVVCANGWPLVI